MWEFSIAKYGDFTKHIDSFDKKKEGETIYDMKSRNEKGKRGLPPLPCAPCGSMVKDTRRTSSK